MRRPAAIDSCCQHSSDLSERELPLCVTHFHASLMRAGVSTLCWKRQKYTGSVTYGMLGHDFHSYIYSIFYSAGLLLGRGYLSLPGIEFVAACSRVLSDSVRTDGVASVGYYWESNTYLGKHTIQWRYARSDWVSTGPVVRDRWSR